MIFGRLAALSSSPSPSRAARRPCRLPAPAGGPQRRRGGSESATVDACTLLEPAEVEGLIGANDGGKGTPGAASSARGRPPTSSR